MVRRIVTGHEAGKAVFISDGPPKGHVFQSIPGMAQFEAWATPPKPTIPLDEQTDAMQAEMPFLPPQGGSTFVILSIAPDSVMSRDDFDAAASAAELAEHTPEIAATIEVDAPGMHRTDTIDYIVVLEGELYLELDDQQERLIKRHDVVIQNGTRHAWRNRSDRPAMLAVVLIGAERKPGV